MRLTALMLAGACALAAWFFPEVAGEAARLLGCDRQALKDDARTHITAMGGSLYVPRSTVSTTLDVETCLDCHGVGKIFDVVRMHR